MVISISGLFAMTLGSALGLTATARSRSSLDPKALAPRLHIWAALFQPHTGNSDERGLRHLKSADFDVALRSGAQARSLLRLSRLLRQLRLPASSNRLDHH